MADQPQTTMTAQSKSVSVNARDSSYESPSKRTKTTTTLTVTTSISSPGVNVGSPPRNDNRSTPMAQRNDRFSNPDTSLEKEFSFPALSELASEMFRVFAHATVADYVYDAAVRDKYVYCDKQSVWYVCDSNVWRAMPEPISLHELTRKTVLGLIKERRALLSDLQEKLQLVPEWRVQKAVELVAPLQAEVDNFKNPERDINSHSFLENISKCIKMNARKHNFFSLLDANPNILACTDAVVHLDTFEWEPLRPDHYVSKTTGFPKPKIRVKLQKKIREIIRSMHTTDEAATYVLQVLARTLVGRNTSQKIYFWVGSGGNGKSLMFTLYEAAAGDSYVLMDIAALTKPKREQNAHSDWDRTIGTRGCFFEEPEEADYMVIGTIKHVTGGGKFICRPAYGKTNLTFTPFFTPHIGTNGMPKLRQVDDAVKRRIELIHHPFNFKSAVDPDFNANDPTHKPRDETLTAKFETVKYGQQFLLILLDELKELGKKEIKQPLQHLAVTRKYFQDQDPVCRFINENYVITGHPCNRVNAVVLHDTFAQSGDAHRKISAQEIRTKIEKMSKGTVTKKPSNGGYWYFGMREKAAHEETAALPIGSSPVGEEEVEEIVEDWDSEYVGHSSGTVHTAQGDIQIQAVGEKRKRV